MAASEDAAAPTIGLTASIEPARWNGVEQTAAIVEGDFLTKLEALGACTVIVPPHPPTARRLAPLLDGLLLSGGRDVDPGRYGERAHPATVGAGAERDEAEIALVEHALAEDLPLLAVCRGCQLLNVALGGTLVQHVPEVTEAEHSPFDERRTAADQPFVEHRVRAAAGSLLERAAGSELKVLSDHHQAVAEPGRGIEPVGWSDDGLVEAIEQRDLTFGLGVQWHPEAHQEAELFEALVDAARARARARARAAGR